MRGREKQRRVNGKRLLNVKGSPLVATIQNARGCLRLGWDPAKPAYLPRPHTLSTYTHAAGGVDAAAMAIKSSYNLLGRLLCRFR